MLRQFICSKTCLLPLLLCSALLCQAETFRVHQLHPMPLADTSSECKVKAGINDALSIQLPQDMTYVNGIELSVKIPEIIAYWRDTVAYSVYNDIKPLPEADKIDYSGERILVGTFPGKLTLTIYIPLDKDFSVRESPYHVILTPVPDTSTGFVFFRMQLAMKGVPESFEDSLFEITAKPVLRDVGALDLSVSGLRNADDGSPLPYMLYIDGVLQEQQEKPALFTTGEHHLSITSQHYRDEVRTFRIEQARTTDLAIQLRDIAPALRIISPKGAELYYDGEPRASDGSEFTITPGEHLIRFVIGDYEIVKTVTAVNGRSYTVNLAIDATVTESE